MICAYVKLLKVILKYGNIPNDWGMAMILPIHENNVHVTDPDNYNGITLLSCLCRLCTSVLNNRLTEHIDQLGILGEKQA